MRSPILLVGLVLLILPAAHALPVVSTGFLGIGDSVGIATQDSSDAYDAWQPLSYPCGRGEYHWTVTLYVSPSASEAVVRLHLGGAHADAAPGETVALTLVDMCATFVVEGVHVEGALPYVVRVENRSA